MQARVVTVGTTPTLITSMGGNALTAQSVLILNPSGGDTIYVGGPDVDDTDGFPVEAGGTLAVDLTQEVLCAVVSSGTVDINVLVGGK